VTRADPVHSLSRRSTLRVVALVLCAGLLLLASSCSLAKESESGEVDTDVGDVTVPGAPPTAPPPDADPPASGAAAFIAELEALSKETDLCRILTGEAFREILSGELDVAGLAGTPAGATQVIVLVDDIFNHVVTIAPPELVPAMTTLDDVWGRISVIPASAADSEQQAAAILAEPQVVADLDTLGRWAALNCELPALTEGSTTTPPGATG
jgi:hypothetical protein